LRFNGTACFDCLHNDLAWSATHGISQTLTNILAPASAFADPSAFLSMDCILELALRRAAPASFRRERALEVRERSAIFRRHDNRSPAACHSELCCFAFGSAMMYAAASFNVTSFLPFGGWIGLSKGRDQDI
jgi:hypothetical protein